ncbi:MAG TPA: hypothetical protein VL738_40425 [Dactylosporangium sp.]|nr:hypothetical protein [Dactylosporangium sp.]
MPRGDALLALLQLGLLPRQQQLQADGRAHRSQAAVALGRLAQQGQLEQLVERGTHLVRLDTEPDGKFGHTPRRLVEHEAVNALSGGVQAKIFQHVYPP